MEWVWTGLICCRTETSGGRALVKTVLNLRVPKNCGKLRDRTSDTWCVKRLYSMELVQFVLNRYVPHRVAANNF